MSKYFSLIPVFTILAIAPFQCAPTKDGGVFVSDDFGESWQQKVNTTGKEILSSADVLDIAIDPNDSKILYLGTQGKGFLKSVNGGETWFQPEDKNGFLDSRASVYDIVIDPKETGRLYIGIYQQKFGQLLRSQDGGESWERVYLVSRPKYAIFAVEIDSYDPAVVYMGTAEGGLLKSTDYGKSWELVKWFDDIISDIKTNPHDTRIVYISTLTQGVYKTVDKGKNWESFKTNLKEFKEAEKVETLIVDPYSPNILYIGSGLGLLKSSDGGTSWQRVKIIIPPNSLPVLDVALDPTNPSRIYYGAGSVLYRSSDGGQNWTVHKIASSRNVKVIAIDPKDSKRVYVGLAKE